MNYEKRFGAFSSSENPDQLASTVKGFILGISVIIIFAVQALFHITWTADNVADLATSIGTIVSSLWIAYGLIKKGVIWLIDKFHQPQV